MRAIHIPAFIVLAVGFNIMSSCIEDEEEAELGLTGRIDYFQLDSLDGRSYAFSIDQLGHHIFNRDSLPFGMDTAIVHVKIDSFSVSGYVTSGLEDTLFNKSVAQNLSAAINNPGGVRFKVYAPSGLSHTTYALNIRIHQQVGDSLNWDRSGNIPSALQDPTKLGKARILTLEDRLFIYDFSNPAAFRLHTATLSDPESLQWQEHEVTGLGSETDLSALTTAMDAFWVSDGHRVFQSRDGFTFSQAASFPDQTILTVVAGSDLFLDLLVKEADGILKIKHLDKNGAWMDGARVDSQFPTRHISCQNFISSTGVPKTVILGPGDGTQTIPFMTLGDGTYISLEYQSEYTGKLPSMEESAILMQKDDFYAIGSGLDSLYKSRNGVQWQLSTSRQMLPASLSSTRKFSATTDSNGYIWILASSQEKGASLYRGRLNRLGFKIQ